MARNTTFSFEFYPPQTQEGVTKLMQTAKELNEYNPEFFSVTFGAGGSTKEKTLEKKVASLTGGSGRRSLLKSGSGGMGFYNEFI